MRTFTFPWPSTDATDTGALEHKNRDPTPITELRPKISRAIAKTIMACLEADPNRRPESAVIVLKMLRNATKDTQ